jgi:hypothetical protein
VPHTLGTHTFKQHSTWHRTDFPRRRQAVPRDTEERDRELTRASLHGWLPDDFVVARSCTFARQKCFDDTLSVMAWFVLPIRLFGFEVNWWTDKRVIFT